jgi:hypothetical protein
METIDRPNRVRQAITAVMVLIGALAVPAGFAAAAPADPTGGAMTSLTGDISSWVTTYGVPGLVVLLGLGLIIRVFIRFARRGASAV